MLYFEREDDGTLPAPPAYSHKALACLSTHDLPTLKGWWSGSDIDERERTGLTSPENAANMRESRWHDRILLLAALKNAGLLPAEMEPILNGAVPAPEDLPDERVHRRACSACQDVLAPRRGPARGSCRHAGAGQRSRND